MTKGERVTTAIRFPKETHDRLAAEAAERELSINFMVTRAVNNYLDALPPVADPDYSRIQQPA